MNDGSMSVEIEVIDSARKEYVKIGCHKIDERIRSIENYVRMQQDSVEGKKDERQYRIPINEIYYVESVDERTFIYLKEECYESGRKLYEFENLLEAYHFTRISKSVIVNLMKVESIKPALNGRFLCKMDNNEEVIISRKYAPEIKKILRGDK